MVPVQGPVQVASITYARLDTCVKPAPMEVIGRGGPGKLPLPPELVRRVVEYAFHVGDY